VSTVVPLPLKSATALPAVGDPAATRTVYAATVVLLLLAIALAVLAVWLFRRTRPEPALFAPLEEMDTRSFRRADPDARRELLDSARPPGARPVALTKLPSDEEPAEVEPEDGELPGGAVTGDAVAADASADLAETASEPVGGAGAAAVPEDAADDEPADDGDDDAVGDADADDRHDADEAADGVAGEVEARDVVGSDIDDHAESDHAHDTPVDEPDDDTVENAVADADRRTGHAADDTPVVLEDHDDPTHEHGMARDGATSN